jgi:hypothetical protein
MNICVKGTVEQRLSNKRRGPGHPDRYWSREQRKYSTYRNEKRVWNYFRILETKFLANNKADNYNEHMENVLLFYQILGCILSLYIIFLNYHKTFFQKTVGH